ncbi:unnamed protein product [Parnassius apollo]|uniref:(apollo) hypothetical protein n=1 Tax=Parnassius apollo TaxID=110799 RepID=A0A8S3Y6T2_PARAO|nr:unnamed protein product [Parnassius apollo]
MLKTESQELVEEPHKIAELFADQFVNSYVREPDAPIPSINMPMVINSIDDVKFTAKIVLKTLLTSILLKRCSSLLAEHISSIMNKSMEDGRLSAGWKKATVVPIYKNGDKMRPSNYRPISLTSILCKAMEKIITERLREFLLQEQLILDEQHGFVPKRSIITNMLQCVNEWVSNHDNGLPTDVIYLDY